IVARLIAGIISFRIKDARAEPVVSSCPESLAANGVPRCHAAWRLADAVANLTETIGDLNADSGMRGDFRRLKQGSRGTTSVNQIIVKTNSVRWHYGQNHGQNHCRALHRASFTPPTKPYTSKSLHKGFFDGGHHYRMARRTT
uniref:hypothetical protein n=1 Tax=Novipirellula sp. TaxID=2795430 RepID=UPI00356680FF